MVNDLNTKNEGNILTVASGALGDANTSYTYFNVGAEGYKYFTLLFPLVTATTLSLEATDDIGSELSAAQWTDVTLALTGAATATAAGGWIVDTPVVFSRMRVKRLTTNATNALKLYLTVGS